MDDMEVPSVGCVSHTPQLAVHKGLLSQCSIRDSPVNTSKMVGQCCNSIRKSHMKVYTLFHQNKTKKLKKVTAWMQVLFFFIIIIKENIS